MASTRQGVLQQRAEAVDLLDDTQHVILDVAEVALQLDVHPVLLEAAGQVVHHGDQRLDGPLEVHHLTHQQVDALRDVGVAVEELLLDLVDVVLQPGHHGGVVVHDLVHDAYRTASGPGTAAPGCSPAAPHAGEVGTLGVPDGDHEVAGR